MPSRFRIIARKTFIVINVVVMLLYLLSCLAPYIKPTGAWYISFFGLAFPFLLVLMILFAFIQLILRSKLVILSVIILLSGFKSILVFWGFNTPTEFRKEKKTSDIRIASWNVARFLEWKKNSSEKSRTRLKMLEQIRQQDADILCLQEFFYSPNEKFYHNVKEIQNMGYPWFCFSYDPDGEDQYIGSVIFSKYPIIDTGIIRYFRPSMPEALIYADLKINSDTIRVFSTHLQSVQFRQRDFEAISEIRNANDSLFANSKTVLSKLRRAMKYRSTQAEVVRQILDDSLYPVIFCGDLNDVPNSYTYFTIRGDMQDAFLKKGFGVGRTYSSLSPTLRIDYLFFDDHFQVGQFTRVVKRLSDHFMLLADVKLKTRRAL
ncbi:MAG TPA: endonuclease/exonuclease/phosphatase family protein [Chitinophagaceae bacterium]|nr:endonuclease/exonuclease/phosphatase family protein [Chitinophagaceae bacterium]